MKIHNEILRTIREKWDDEEWIESQVRWVWDRGRLHRDECLWNHLSNILEEPRLEHLACCSHKTVVCHGEFPDDEKRKKCWKDSLTVPKYEQMMKAETICAICHDFIDNNHEIPRYIYANAPHTARIERVINDMW